MSSNDAANDDDRMQREIQSAKRVSLWLLGIGGLLGLSALVVLAMVGQEGGAALYALPVAMFATFFLFLAGLHYVTGVWAVRRRQD